MIEELEWIFKQAVVANRSTIPEFSLKDCRKPRKSSVGWLGRDSNRASSECKSASCTATPTCSYSNLMRKHITICLGCLGYRVTKFCKHNANGDVSQWPCGLRDEISSPAQTLGSWVRIPLETWLSVRLYYVSVFFCVGSGIATGLIPRPRGPTDCL
jgi:hypothetical protein